ncbi:MAG: fibrobacter succinogenes major paralogous domain-containing protein, partial [Bacteroidales bacterium]|nr:fibrobacter succinogenes major paralogous domain-containing protein [Bacteroidales bacterium]
SQSCSAAPTVTDHEGNVYATVQIGDQCWMRENLRTKHFANGYEIIEGDTSTTDIPYYYYPNNNEYNMAAYGLLYNAAAVQGLYIFSNDIDGAIQGICPSGWHLPSSTEWTQLANFVGSQNEYVCGSSSQNILKSLASTTGWINSTTDCAVGNNPNDNNATGFNALPAGYCYGSNSFSGGFGTNATFWSSTHILDPYQKGWEGINMSYNYPYRTGHQLWSSNPIGASVRCIRGMAIPFVSTLEINGNASTGTATCGGNVYIDGGSEVTARGVCWSTSPNPTIADSHTLDGSGLGSFNSNITGLTPGPVYYVRAYATNSGGTAYGEQVTFYIPAPIFSCGNAITDYDGNKYNTVQIGNQCWMKENLRVTHYANGTSIEEGSNSSDTTPLYYNPYYSFVGVGGLSYNKWAIMGDYDTSNTYLYNVQGICPDGWHVPNYDEWTQLVNYVRSRSEYVCGGNSIAKALASTTGWRKDTTSCAVGNTSIDNNATGFSAFPTGSGGWNVSFATAYDPSDSYYPLCNFRYDHSYIDRYWTTNPYMSVRCLRNVSPNGDTQPCPGTPTVTDKDGNTYNTVKIGDQCWMRENLRTTKYADGSAITAATGDGSTNPYYYNNTSSSIPLAARGYLYNWSAVMNGAPSSHAIPSGVQGICPTGWHVPSDEEWEQLSVYVRNQNQFLCGNNSRYINKSLAATEGWNNYSGECCPGDQSVTMNNATGFSAVPAGQSYGIWVVDEGTYAYFWTSTELTSTNVHYWSVHYNYEGIGSTNLNNNKLKGYSVRCLRDVPPSRYSLSCPAAPTVTDHEGNVYATVQIGDQCWMRENLRTTTSPSTGTYLIPAAGTNYTYTGKQARWYNNDSTTYAPMNYGLLYNWNAAVDTFNTTFGETSVNNTSSNAMSVNFTSHRRGICPAGWHLPSDAEWDTMTTYVGSQSEYVCGENNNHIGKALALDTGWNNSANDCAVGNNQASNNATGFSAVPAGYCIGSSFGFAGYYAYFWSSSQLSGSHAHYYPLGYDYAYVYRTNFPKYLGYSVRCLRDELSPVSSLPYSTNFYDDDTWTLNNGTCSNYWTKDPTNGLFVTNDGDTPGYDITQASTVMAEKLLLMPSSDSIHIEFDVRVGGENGYDYLKVFLAPSSVTYTAGTSHNTQSSTSYSTYAVDFSNFKSQTQYSSNPYTFNLTNGNTIHVSVNVANPNANDTAKLVFLWRDDTSMGTQPGAIVSQLSVSEVPQHTISVSLTTDLYGSETTWQVKDISSNTVLASGGPYSDLSNSVTQIQNIPDIIVDGTGCYVFIINDSYGDGICCSYGNGS